MKNILSQANREVLEQLAWSNALLAFDYDGTLAPIVKNPRRAIMRRSTRRYLDQLTRLYPCVIISGRSQIDARSFVEGIAFRGIVGNHGLEPWYGTEEFMRAVDRWKPLLAAGLSAYPGIRVEDKIFSVAIHYRGSRQRKKARAAILERVAGLGPVRVIPGKLVINVLPPGAPHKGTALERERTRTGCDTALYVGDDETDEDVFALDQPGRLLTIRVGASNRSLANYCIANQFEIDELLSLLIRLRLHSVPARQVKK